MTIQRLILIVLLLQMSKIDTQRTCLTDCIINGLKGTPLVVSDGRCTKAPGQYCETVVSINYHTGQYTVEIRASSLASYASFIYALASDSLYFDVTYSCSQNDTCALEFAQRKLLDLSGRPYNSSVISSEIAPFLQETRPQGVGLICFDHEGMHCAKKPSQSNCP